MAFTQSGMSAEALAAAAELEVRTVNNPAVVNVINDMLKPDSLPPGWEARYDPINERREYVNRETGEVQYVHPLASYYHGAAFMEMGGYRQLQVNEADQPPAPQEVLDMCAYLGVSASNDDPYVVEVARLAISAPLPPHWVEGEDEDGNPLFTNRQTGQSQPSHPLDAYFLELIKRRKRELAVHSDGVGIRSSLAAKRLYEIGVPGIELPPELKGPQAGKTGGGGAMWEEEADGGEEEDDPSAAARNFGPLLPIEEAEDEGRDEDEDHHKTAKQPPPPPPQQQQKEAQRQQHLLLEDFDGLEEEEKETPPPPPAVAPAATRQEEKDEDEVDTAEAERRRKAQWELDEWARRQEEEEEEEQRLAEAEKLRVAEAEKLRVAEAEKLRVAEAEKLRVAEAEKLRVAEAEKLRVAEAEKLRVAEAEKLQQQQLQAERERERAAMEKEKERKEKADREERERAEEAARQRQQRLREAEGEKDGADLGVDVEAERRRLKEQEEKEKAAAKKAAERQALLDALREADGDLGADEEEEEEEEEEEVMLPTLAKGISGVAVLRQAASMDSGISATAQLLPPPPPVVEPSAAAAAAEDSGGENDEEEDDDEDDEEEDVTLAPHPPKLPPTAAVETAERLVLGTEEEEGKEEEEEEDDDDDDDDEKEAKEGEKEEEEEEEKEEEKEEEEEKEVTAAPPAVPEAQSPPRSAAPTTRARRRTDDDEYAEDFESYCSDFESYASSRQATREGSRTAGTTRHHAASRPVTTSRQLTAAAGTAAALTAPTTPEKLPSRSPTPPPPPPPPPPMALAAEQEEEYDADGAASIAASSRLPSPPALPPPGSLTPRRHSTAGSQRKSQDGRRVEPTQGSSRARSAAASLAAAEDEDERDAEPGGEDGDDEAGEDEEDADGKARRGKVGSAQSSRRAAVGDSDGGDDEDDAVAMIRVQAAEAARRAAAAAAEFNAMFPPLPVALDEGGGELRRSRSYSDVETGKLLKELSAIEAARSVATHSRASTAATSSDAAAAAAAGSVYAVARLPSGRLELLRSRTYGSVGSTSAGTVSAAAAAAAAAVATPSRNAVREPSRERIRVAVRARPVPKAGDKEAWIIDPASRTVRLKEGAANSTHRHISADRVYSFDLVLSPKSTTKQLWASHVVPLMDASLGGVNTTVFAYGQTGSGKTYTMFGSDGRYEDGAIAMSLTYLFKALKTLHKIKGGAEEYSVKISMLELYNEQLRDLLAPGGGPFDRLGRPSGAPLALQDDPRVGVRVHGLEEHAVADVPAAMALVARGAFSRSVGSTAMNEVSSRSHTIVRLALETREAASHELLHTSLVSFVDLAGSERLAKTGSTGARFVEGTNINISLLMLGTVVSKLAEGRVGEFIPYRNSKLTRLLQPCLGGNSKTAIIATINPSADQIEETFNTLGFATRAMDVVNQVSVNSYIRSSGAVGGALSGAAAAALQKQVATLKAELAALKKEAGGGVSSGTAMLAAAHDGGGNMALIAERLARLEIEKARLLDRLEALTGRPQGDVYDDLPPTPPDLNLPPARPPGRTNSSGSLITSGTTPLVALRSISRLACVGRGGAGAASKQLIPRHNEQIPPDEVVMAVRSMRDERDELRRRDAKLRQNLEEVRARLAEVEPYRVLGEQVKEVVGMLENILGPSPLAEAAGQDDLDPAAAASSQAARLAENVQAVAMMHNELAALQRQLATSEAVAAVATRRSENAEAALQRAAAVAASEQGVDGRLKNMVEQLNSQLTGARRELDVTKSELAKWRDLSAVAPEVGGPGAPPAVAAAAAAAAGGGKDSYDDDEDDDPGKRLLGPASLNVGSFALRRAREAIAQASVLETRCNAAEAERDELRDRLQALEAAVASGAPIGRGLLPPYPPQGANPRQRQQRPVSASGLGEGSSDPQDASRGGEAGQQRFEQLRTHVSSLSREVSALTRERDTLLGMVLRIQPSQAPQPNGALGGSSLNPIASVGRPMGHNGSSLLYGGVGGSGGYPLGTNNVFSSVPLPHDMRMDSMGMGPGGGGGGGARGRGGPLAASALDPNGLWEMDPMMAAALMRGGGSPVKLKPVRGRVPHHHHHRRLRDGHLSDGYGSGGGNGNNGNNDIANRPEFNTRDMPLEAKHRVNRLRDRASRLDAPTSDTPPPMEDEGIVGKGLGPMQEQEPILYSHRDAEVYALKRKLVLAEKARSEAAARSQSELRNMQYGDLLNYRAGGVGGGLGGDASAAVASMGFSASTQMALAAANRDFKEQARSHAAEMRHLEVAHEENLAAARAEATAVFKQLVEENNRLKVFLAAGGAPGAANGGGSMGDPGGGGGSAAVDFPLRSYGGFGARDRGGMRMSYSESPPRRGPSHLSPLRGPNMSPPRNQHGSTALPMLQPSAAAGGGGGTRSERGRVFHRR